jgi:CARDB
MPSPTHRTRLALVLSALLLPFVWTGGIVAAPRIPPGPVTITVHRADDDKPLRGVVIRLGGRWAASRTDGSLVLDGVPTGAYRLEAAHPGFDRLALDVGLADGAREPIALKLVPSPLPAIKGRVATKRGDVPLAGAGLRLTPVEVSAAIQGPYALRTNWDGNFSVPRIPPGRYRVEADAAGCRSTVTEWTVTPEGGDFAIALERIVTRESLSVRAVEDASGAPLAGARVILAEAWPTGLISETRTGSDGLARFANLLVGRINRADAEGRCAVSRRRVTVRVEAVGHAVKMTEARIGSDAPVEVRLAPLAAVEAPEDPGGLPADVLLGRPVLVTVHPEGDVDALRFRLPCSGLLKIRIGKTTLPAQAVLIDPDGKQLTAPTCHAGQTIAIDHYAEPGTHVLEVKAWGRVANEAAFPVHVDFEACPDPHEPNDTLARARTLRSGEEIRGWLTPRGDVDMLTFRMERSGWFRALLARCPSARTLKLLDHQGKKIREWPCHAGQAIDVSENIAVGRYFLAVTWWGQGSSTAPYSVRLLTIEDDGIDDPPLPGAIRTLTPPGAVSSTILPTGDRDTYLVPVPGPGHLTLTSHATIGFEVRVLTRHGKQLDRHLHHAGQVGATRLFFDEADAVIVDAGCWGNGSSSPVPYRLTASFEPADQWDDAGRNDAFASATPWELSETMRGNIMPVRDVDPYRFTVDRPGWLRLELTHPALGTHLRMLDDRGVKLTETTAHPRQISAFEREVLPGSFIAEARCWGDRGAAAGSYLLRGRLTRAEPEETVPLNHDAVRALAVGEGRAWTIDQRGDLDRFVFSVPREGSYRVLVWNPINFACVLTDDRTGDQVGKTINHASQTRRFTLEVKGPTRYRLDLSAWGSGRTHLPGFVLVREGEGEISAEYLAASVDPLDPTLVTFTRKPAGGLTAGGVMSIDADGDGKPDVDLPAGGTLTYRLASEGVYAARGRLAAADGTFMSTYAWVEAIGPKERKGVHVVVDHPAEGAVVMDDRPIGARALSWTGQPITGVTATIDGRFIGRDVSAPFAIDVPWRRLGGGEHVLAVTARDRGGESATVERRFRVSDYFDLQPLNGAVVTGSLVRVGWVSGGFTPTIVRVRKQGEQTWHEVVGESGRRHALLLRDLEPGVTYEFQPTGGAEAGPARSVTRVKGLAFSRAVFGATIRRDYDQRVAISVRNHAEEPMTVRLVCGKPDDPLLLVGFVGDGSEDAPFDLGPGEERDILLGLSAQDVITPSHVVPVRITSDAGYSDEAEVRVEVKLPEVKLVWEETEEVAGKLGRTYRLRNEGDGLTDLSLDASEGLLVRPRLEHAAFPKGRTLEVVVEAVLDEGFERVDGEIVASAVGKSSAQPVALALEPGQRVFGVPVYPGADSAMDPEEAEDREARALVGALLRADAVDWSRRTDPRDTDGDGRVDTWTVDETIDRTLWTGQDTDGDGEIDFATADIGYDGQIDHASALREKGWTPTKIIEAWLDVKFGLPWARSSYQPHDVDVMLNGIVVGRIRNEIPEGNYTFRIPPTAIKTDGGDNTLGLDTTHLRGGHYVVSSDFSIRVRTTGSRVMVVAGSEEEAREKVTSLEGLNANAPDFSVSTSEIAIEGGDTPEAGKPVAIVVPLRNIGAVAGRGIPVALFRGRPGEPGEEVDRTMVEYLPAGAGTPVRMLWTAEPGAHTLRVVVDPDGETPDPDAANNEALAHVKVPGDETPPTVKLVEPTGTIREAVTAIRVEASDDVRVARVEVRIDGGLWMPLAPRGKTWEGRALLQPGQRTISVRARDASGNPAEATSNVQVAVDVPRVRLLVEPEVDAEIDARTANVKVQCGPDAQVVLARVDGGPWRKLEVADDIATGEVPLTYGACSIETKVVDSRGVAMTSTRNVTCTKQRSETDAPPPPAADPDSTTIDVPGIGPVDVADPGSVVRPPVGGGAPPPIPEPGDEEPFEEEPHDVDPGEWEDMDEDAPADGTSSEAETFDGVPPDGEADNPTVPPVADPKPMPPMPPAPVHEGMPDWECDIPEPPAPPPAGLGGGGSSARPGRGRGAPSGGAVVVNTHKRDRYCTNRPKIRPKFRFPPELWDKWMPKPGTEVYKRWLKKYLKRLRDRGIDTTPFEKFQAILEKRAQMVDQPDKLPTFLQSLGLGKGPYKSEYFKKLMQETHLKSAQAFYLRALSSGNPQLIAEGLQARYGVIKGFDQALALEADAMMQEIKNNQRAAEQMLYLYGPAGLALDIVNCARGETLSGDKMTAMHYGLTGLFRLGPLGIKGLAGTRRGQQFIGWAGTKTAWIGENARLVGGGLNEMFGNAIGQERANKLLGWTWDQLTRKRALTHLNGLPKTSKAALDYMRRAEGLAAKARLGKDIARANQLIDKLRNAGSKTEWRKYVLKLQQNKTAIAQINLPGVPPELRSQVNKTLKAFGRLTDRKTCKAILSSNSGQSAIQRILKKNPGMKASDIRVRSRTITGQGGSTVGRDRDVWFQWVTKDGKVIGDVHHNISTPIYGQQLKKVTGFSAEQLDHAVTSWWHPEAYNTGKVDPQQLIDGKLAGKLPRPEDVRDTILFKTGHFFEQAKAFEKAGKLTQADRAYTEAMRQALKEYNRHLRPLLEAKGLDPKVILPPRLFRGLELFKQAQEGLKGGGGMTVNQVREALGAITCRVPSGARVPANPERIASDLAHYVEAVNKWGVIGGK